MKTAHLLLGAAAALLLPLGAAAAPRSTGDKNLDSKLTGLIESSFLQVQCPVPSIQPRVSVLKRSMSPNPEQLRRQFFGDGGVEVAELSVTSPLWGRGRRLQASFEASFKLRTGPEDKPDMQQEGGISKGTVVPLSLDLYPRGFIYVNNVPHLPVLGTEIKEGGSKAEVSRTKVYSDTEGAKLAKQEIASKVGAIQVPDGFRQVEQSSVQSFGQRLFVYRTSLEHVTDYTLYKNDAKGNLVASGTQPVAVPVLDCFAHVLLDGDKALAGMEYFWDNNLNPTGERKEAINAAQALIKGREWLFKTHNGSPPLLTVSQIRLGYIQDRKNPAQLIPAWLFDASYSATVTNRDTTSASLSTISTPFGVNALTGEPIDL